MMAIRCAAAVAVLLAGLLPPASAWSLSKGAMDYYLAHIAAGDDDSADFWRISSMASKEAGSKLASIAGQAKKGRRGSRGRGRKSADWRAAADTDAAAEQRRARGRRDLAHSGLARPEGWESVQLELLCEGTKLACDLTTKCNAVACTKTTKDGSRFSVKQAPLFLRGAMEMWSSPAGAKCSVRERPARGVSCAGALFPKRVVAA